MEDTERQLQAEIYKEIEKLKYYLEESDELIKRRGFLQEFKRLKSIKELKLQERFVRGKRTRKKSTPDGKDFKSHAAVREGN